MQLHAGGPAPYTSTAAATTLIDAFRNRGLGVPVTPEVAIRAGVPETLASRTLKSLLELGLLDKDGKPTEQFEDFRRIRGEEEYRSRLQEWVRGIYADVLQYTDPSTDSGDRVVEAFRGYEPAGQRRAMAALLVGLWRYAGLPVIASASAPPAGGSSGSQPVRSRPRKASTSTKREPLSAEPGSTHSGAGIHYQVGGLPPGLLGLLQQIPQNGRGWTEDRRDAFMEAFSAVLNFTVPIADEEHEEADDGQEEEELET